MSDDDILAPIQADDDELEVAALTGDGTEAANDRGAAPAEPTSEELVELARVQAALGRRQGEAQVELRLDATARACELLGDIHASVPALIVTGTNGKTSTVRMIDALLSAHGLRTGRFSSPHLHSITERMSVDGHPVSADAFIRVYDEIAPVMDIVDAELAAQSRPGLTYFEALTVLAYAVFADAPVDVNVIEVGMGGEWDSTNVTDAHVCVFTPVGLDHVAFLGDTVEEIAATKAGILNRTLDSSPAPDPVAVVGTQEAAVSEVLADEISRRGADSRWQGSDFELVETTRAVDGQLIHLRTRLGDYPDVFLPLHGSHQAQNAALALAAVEAFLATEDRPLDPETVGDGFSSVTSPGRLEVLHSEPTVVVDGAHNPHAARVLSESISETFDFADTVAVVAMFADKDPHGVLEHIHRFATRVVVTQVLSNPRAMQAQQLASAASEWWDSDDVIVADDMNAALMKALDAAADGPDGRTGIVVTGSLSTVAEARTLLGKRGAL